MTHLFGGAIVSDIPDGWVDVSNFRQVPDNQEVFLHPDFNVSIVVEVLEPVPEPTDVEAIKLHFEALAHDNDAISITMQSPFVIQESQPIPIILLRGSQRIRKFNASTAEDVDILVALFRVRSEGKNADIVVSMSIPGGPECGGEEYAAADTVFNSLVSSLRIVDYGLFC